MFGFAGRAAAARDTREARPTPSAPASEPEMAWRRVIARRAPLNA
jgi:hypothetical protein